MRHAILCSPLLVLAACGSSPSQTGDIGSCGGITLSGAGAFVPLSGMVFQEEANLGAGASAAGTYEVVIWAGSADAGTANQSQTTNCSRLLAGDLQEAVSPFIAPETLEFNLQDSFAATTYSTQIAELTAPISESTVTLEDILGNVNLSTSAGETCLSGNFTANLAPVDPASGFTIDGGTVLPISGTFSLPYCH